ncbi:MsnO8 family LLM class oxidoreductase [Streptomyces sp. TRM 70351]|uniref:MsnO8 family LLM class oxidoreductase n=1 Tax=Streptomyces sp. TRM 70351 TaxID=3116552 RepID=UPI002E7C1460|nr:MsnO8 family LLM class oxidoreductase [Streptomyces sp. TRM 70351]MEE1927204.1 MsnO8 family LLM class oxidoreductase [Streptomyces sp. TRM 70351]
MTDTDETAGGDLELLRATRFSLLDRSLVREGRPPEESLRETVRFAQAAERLGFHRFWVAEHHGVPGVAGSAPTVLASAVAAATSRIRVGTGGVMLPNHRPLVVAEQFGVLEALYPGRVDLGLGRSLGFTGAVRRALGTGKEAAEGFAERLGELLDYLDGAGPVPALPAVARRIPAFVLAGDAGADVAAAHGLPLVVAAGRDGQRLAATVRRYRDGFRPSARATTPYVVLALGVAVAATAREAARRQLPEAWSVARSRVTGVFAPLVPAGRIPAEPDARERRYLAEARAGQVHGTTAEVAATLAALIRRTGADEVLSTLSTYDPAERLDSAGRLAELTMPSAAPSATTS